MASTIVIDECRSQLSEVDIFASNKIKNTINTRISIIREIIFSFFSLILAEFPLGLWWPVQFNTSASSPAIYSLHCSSPIPTNLPIMDNFIPLHFFFQLQFLHLALFTHNFGCVKRIFPGKMLAALALPNNLSPHIYAITLWMHSAFW